MTTRALRRAYYREARRLTRQGRPRHRYFTRSWFGEIPLTVETVPESALRLYGEPDGAPAPWQLAGSVTGYLTKGTHIP